MLYPQDGDRIVTIDSVTSLHPMYKKAGCFTTGTCVYDLRERLLFR